MEVTERRRYLIQSIIDGYSDNLVLVHQLDHFKERELIYSWLINNKITGKKFFFFCKDFGFGKVSIAEYILTKIYKMKKKGIFIGKDLI
jgi:hypothetical protein